MQQEAEAIVKEYILPDDRQEAALEMGPYLAGKNNMFKWWREQCD